jgi:hypothetical protein
VLAHRDHQPLWHLFGVLALASSHFDALLPPANDMSQRVQEGARVELAMAKLLGAKKVSRAYQAGHELALGEDRMLRIECKARADGFRELYSWLYERDLLVLKGNRREPLVVVRLSLAAEIGKRTP